MAPTILIAGATGNTGRSVVETLSTFKTTSNNTFSSYRILALTRSLDNPAAQQLTKLPGVEVAEKNWIEITADWLRENEVVRAFIASTAESNQFITESSFHIAALDAGVKYVVRISTIAANVRPDSKAYYPRSHWAIETMLSSPGFKSLQWTSLQPNIFSPLYLYTTAEFIKEYRKTGKQGTLSLIGAADVPVAIIDPTEIGVIAARLLTEENPARHNNARYVLNGPEDITGSQIVKLVEQYIGVPIENIVYKDTTLVDYMAAASKESKNVTLSAKDGMDVLWNGQCTASTTSKEILELAAPKRTTADVLKAMLGE